MTAPLDSKMEGAEESIGALMIALDVRLTGCELRLMIEPLKRCPSSSTCGEPTYALQRSVELLSPNRLRRCQVESIFNVSSSAARSNRRGPD